jgi:hypothetical protein
VTRRVLAFLILNVAWLLVIAGAFYDLFVPTVPPNHLSYLDVTAGQLDERIAALDLGMLRVIGGCLLAIGITALILTNGPVRRGEGLVHGQVASRQGRHHHEFTCAREVAPRPRLPAR